jgi:hypothetical protein
MSRERILAVTVVVILLVGMQTVEVAEANPFMFGPYIGILSPEQFSKKTYQTSTIPIQIQIETPTDYQEILKIYCIVDLNYSSNNNPQKTLSISNPQPSTYSGVASISYLGSGTLTNLSDGSHNLDAYAVNVQGKIIKSSTRIFLVNTTSAYPSPSLTISPSPSPTLIPSESPTQTPIIEPDPSPSILEFPSLILLPLILAVTVAASLAFKRKKLQES